MYCGNCGKEIKEHALFCSHCGSSTHIENCIQSVPKPKKKRKIAIMSVIILIPLISLVAVFFSNNSNDYKKAVKLVEDGRFDEALAVIETLPKDKQADFLFAPSKTIVTEESDGEIKTDLYFYEYDNDGNCIDLIHQCPDGSEIKNVFEYDNGLLVSRTRTSADGTTMLFEFEYDSKQRLIELLRTVSDGTSTTTYSYEGNNLVKLTQTDGNGNNTYTTVYTYDDNGNLTQSDTIRNHDGTVSESISKYTYDESGNCLSEQHGSYQEIYYTYDTDGNMLTKVELYNGESWLKETYCYDRQNNCIETLGTYKSGRPGRKYYEYDGVGNCFKYTSTSTDGTKVTEHQDYQIYYRPNCENEWDTYNNYSD